MDMSWEVTPVLWEREGGIYEVQGQACAKQKQETSRVTGERRVGFCVSGTRKNKG